MSPQLFVQRHADGQACPDALDDGLLDVDHTYPIGVVLTGLFASQHWRDHSHLPAKAARRLGLAPQKWVAIPKTRRS